MSAIIRKIIAYEHGELTASATLELFSDLVVTGVAWQLQGSYGRAAAGLIQAGYLTEDGNVTEAGHEMAEEAGG